MPRSAKQTNSKPTIPPPKSTIPAPAPSTHSAQAPAPKSSIQGPSMMDTIKQGFSFGIGSAIAHNLFKPRAMTTQESMHDLYNKCIENNDITINCNVYLEKA